MPPSAVGRPAFRPLSQMWGPPGSHSRFTPPPCGVAWSIRCWRYGGTAAGAASGRVPRRSEGHGLPAYHVACLVVVEGNEQLSVAATWHLRGKTWIFLNRPHLNSIELTWIELDRSRSNSIDLDRPRSTSIKLDRVSSGRSRSTFIQIDRPRLTFIELD